MRLGGSRATETEYRNTRGRGGASGRLPGALFVVAWLACLAPAAAAPVAGEEPAAAPLAVQRVTERGIARIPLSDEGAMVLVGAALIGLAAAVRRAT